MCKISSKIHYVMTHIWPPRSWYDLTIMFSSIPCAVHDPKVWLIPMDGWPILVGESSPLRKIICSSKNGVIFPLFLGRKFQQYQQLFELETTYPWALGTQKFRGSCCWFFTCVWKYTASACASALSWETGRSPDPTKSNTLRLCWTYLKNWERIFVSI